MQRVRAAHGMATDHHFIELKRGDKIGDNLRLRGVAVVMIDRLIRQPESWHVECDHLVIVGEQWCDPIETLQGVCKTMDEYQGRFAGPRLSPGLISQLDAIHVDEAVIRPCQIRNRNAVAVWPVRVDDETAIDDQQ